MEIFKFKPAKLKPKIKLDFLHLEHSLNSKFWLIWYQLKPDWWYQSEFVEPFDNIYAVIEFSIRRKFRYLRYSAKNLPKTMQNVVPQLTTRYCQKDLIHWGIKAYLFDSLSTTAVQKNRNNCFSCFFVTT